MRRTVGRRRSRRLLLPSAVTMRLAGLSRLTRRERHRPHTHGDRKGRRLGYEPASDGDRQPREADELPETTSGWSPPVQEKQGHVRAGPGGRGTKEARSAAAAKREAPAGRVVPTCIPGGRWSAACSAGQKCTGKTACCFSAGKRQARPSVLRFYAEGAYNQ